MLKQTYLYLTSDKKNLQVSTRCNSIYQIGKCRQKNNFHGKLK
jgi:hypothetical protein